MKNLIIFIALSIVLLSCNSNDDLLTQAAEEGVTLRIDEMSGVITGTPVARKSLEEAEIEFYQLKMKYKVGVEARSREDVSRLIITKTFKGQTVEVAEVDKEFNWVSKYYNSIDGFMEGFVGLSKTDIRIGDVMVFGTTIIMNDGRTVAQPKADLSVEVSCGADLSGTYLVTNTACSWSYFPVEETITANSDGTWHLTSADGVFGNGCVGIHVFNSGNITEHCGEILPSGDLIFGSDGGFYDIGDIVGGSWDAEAGILTMHHIQTLSENWPAEWTSTYVRQ